MDQTAKRDLDTQALEQVLIGHMMAITGEANQIFRPTAIFDYGIVGELEFRDPKGKPAAKNLHSTQERKLPPAHSQTRWA